MPEESGNKRSTQCDRVLRHLLSGRSLTGAEAMAEYGIQHLASRITELKQKGYPIVVSRESRKNRYGEKVNYSRYSLLDEGADEECPMTANTTG